MSDREPTNDELAAIEPEDEGEVLEWVCHPLKRKPLVAIAVSLFITIVGALVYRLTDSQAFGLLACLVLFASLAKFYLPTRFRLTDRRISIKTTTQTFTKPWSNFRTCYPDKNGILLSPFAEPSRLENFRGMYLIFNQNADEVTEFVKTRIVRAHEEAPDEPAPGESVTDEEEAS